MCRLHYDYMLGFQFAETVDTEIVEIHIGKGFETESPACGKTEQEEYWRVCIFFVLLHFYWCLCTA